MNIYLKDADVTILHADVLDGLRSLEPEPDVPT